MSIVKQVSPEGTLYNGQTIARLVETMQETGIREEHVKFFIDNYHNETDLSFILPELKKQGLRSLQLVMLIRQILQTGLKEAHILFQDYSV